MNRTGTATIPPSQRSLATVRHYPISTGNRLLIMLFIGLCLLTSALHATWLVSFFELFQRQQLTAVVLVACALALPAYAVVFLIRYRIEQRADQLLVQYAFRRRQFIRAELTHVSQYALLGLPVARVQTRHGERNSTCHVPILGKIDRQFWLLPAETTEHGAEAERGLLPQLGLPYLLIAVVLQLFIFFRVNQLVVQELLALYLLPIKPLPEAAQSESYKRLQAGAFVALVAEQEAQQKEFAAGRRSDLEWLAASREFYSVDRTLVHHYQDGLAQLPDSATAQLLTGIFYKYLAIQYQEGSYYDYSLTARTAIARWARLRASRALQNCLQRDADNMLCGLHYLDVAQDRADAQRHWQRLEQRFPDNLILKRKQLLLLSARRRGSVEQMTEYFAKLSRSKLAGATLHRLEGTLKLEQAHLAQLSGDTAAYLTLLRQGLQQEPDDRVGLRRLAKLALDQQQYEIALTLLDRVSGEFPLDELALGYAGYALQQLARFDEAAASYLLAAELGDPYSQSQIAKFFWEGRAVKKDPAMSLYWLDQASARGYEPAVKDRAKVLRLLAEPR